MMPNEDLSDARRVSLRGVYTATMTAGLIPRGISEGCLFLDEGVDSLGMMHGDCFGFVVYIHSGQPEVAFASTDNLQYMNSCIRCLNLIIPMVHRQPINRHSCQVQDATQFRVDLRSTAVSRNRLIRTS